MLGFYDYTVILTYLSVVSSVVGMCCAVGEKYTIALVCLLISGLCDMFDGMVATMKANKENMLRAAQKGFINATDLADYLVKKGMPFRSAYKIVGQIVAECIEKDCVLDTFALEDYKKYITVLPDDPQEPEIRRLIAYLEGEIQRIQEEAIRFAEEQKRLEEENARMQAELARQQAEREAAEAELRAAEAERRRKLLEDVANSLQQTDTVNMTAGAEDVLEYDYESELE